MNKGSSMSKTAEEAVECYDILKEFEQSEKEVMDLKQRTKRGNVIWKNFFEG